MRQVELMGRRPVQLMAQFEEAVNGFGVTQHP
jgi:hypothetical protein